VGEFAEAQRFPYLGAGEIEEVDIIEGDNIQVTTQTEALQSDDIDLKEWQQSEDAAVSTALKDLVKSLQHTGSIFDTVDILLCGDPADLGVLHEELVAMEKGGYEKSGYGRRAEGADLFEKASRGYEYKQHGPLRFVVIVQKNNSGQKPIAFFNYFRVEQHLGPHVDKDLDHEYEDAAQELESELGTQPAICIVSKLVAAPDIDRSFVALPGRAVAATLQALANENYVKNKAGIVIETRAQPATQVFVEKRLGRYILGLRKIFNILIDGDDEGRGPSWMFLYIPPSSAVEE
jgi:hypothetical protein